MKNHKLLISTAAVAALVGFLAGYEGLGRRPGDHRPSGVSDIPSPPPSPFEIAATVMPANTTRSLPRLKIKHRAAELTPEERAEFEKNFEKKYKPAIAQWCKAFDGHVPLAAEDVTVDKFVERIGLDPATYSEYIFVVNGITLGVQENRRAVRVDYLNAPQQTRKLATLPDGSQPPIAKTPITRQEVAQMILAAGGAQFLEHEIRITPSGFSGSLNGGAFVHVGGTPENGASWKYDMVFDPDGNLAYYLKGNN